MQDGAEVKPVVTSSDYVTKNIDVNNSTTLESNTQKAEKAARELEKQAKAEKAKKEEEKKKNQNNAFKEMDRTVSMTGMTAGEKAPDKTAEMAAADKFAEENNKFNQTVQMFIDEAQKRYSNDADGYAKFLNAGIETIKRGASKFTIAETSAAIQEQKDLMNNVDIVVLAQGSMARLVEKFNDKFKDVILTSPRSGVLEVKKFLKL